MEFTIAKHGRQWGIFSATSKCFVCFGKKKDLIKKCDELNRGK